MQPSQGWTYSPKKFREAITKEEHCKVPLDSDWGSKPIYDNLSFKDRSLRSFKDFLIENMRKEYHEYCPKSKSSNIVFCPEKIIKWKKEFIRVQLINDYFKNLGRKSKKKKNKQKGKERTKKNKKTKSKKRKIKRKRKKLKRKKKKTKRKRKKTKRKKRKISKNFN